MPALLLVGGLFVLVVGLCSRQYNKTVAELVESTEKALAAARISGTLQVDCLSWDPKTKEYYADTQKLTLATIILVERDVVLDDCMYRAISVTPRERPILVVPHVFALVERCKAL
jgi:hypothetical protein